MNAYRFQTVSIFGYKPWSRICIALKISHLHFEN